MEKIKNSKKEGETDVKSDPGPSARDERTILKTTNVFDVGDAGVKRGRGVDWSDFQLIGASNREEGEYNNSSGDSERCQRAMERLRASQLGKRIARIGGMAARTA